MQNCNIHPTAIISEEVKFGDNFSVGPFSVIEGPICLGDNVTIRDHVVIKGDTHIGSGAEIFPFSTIGDTPIHLRYAGKNTQLRIGKNALIREHAVIHRGSEAEDGITVIGDNLVLLCGGHIAHDCHVGNHVMISVGSILGGHVRIGDYATTGAHAAAVPFLHIGEHSFVEHNCLVKNHNVLPFSLKTSRDELFHLNKYGLKKRNFSKNDIRALYKSFMILNDKSLLFGDKIKKIEDTLDTSHTKILLSFIQKKTKFGY